MPYAHNLCVYLFNPIYIYVYLALNLSFEWLVRVVTYTYIVHVSMNLNLLFLRKKNKKSIKSILLWAFSWGFFHRIWNRKKKLTRQLLNPL